MKPPKFEKDLYQLLNFIFDESREEYKYPCSSDYEYIYSSFDSLIEEPMIKEKINEFVLKYNRQ